MVAFKYLGLILAVKDYDWPVVLVNLQKARKKWAWMSRILGREGEDAWMSGNLFKEVMQDVLLFL